MSILELKKEYNRLLTREKKAEEFLNNCSSEEFSKWVGEFYKITKQLSMLMQKIPNMNDDEVLNGFKEVNNDTYGKAKA